MREEHVAPPTADETNRALLESARKTDLEAASDRLMREAAIRGKPLTQGEADNRVEMILDVDGPAKLLPHYTKVYKNTYGVMPGERPQAQIADDGVVEEQPKAARQTPDQTVEIDGTTYNLSQMERTIQRAIVAGTDASDSIAFLKYLKSKASN